MGKFRSVNLELIVAPFPFFPFHQRGIWSATNGGKIWDKDKAWQGVMQHCYGTWRRLAYVALDP